MLAFLVSGENRTLKVTLMFVFFDKEDIDAYVSKDRSTAVPPANGKGNIRLVKKFL